jgi:hypothetical protein
VERHKDASTAFGVLQHSLDAAEYKRTTYTHRALLSQALDLPIRVDLVILEDRHLDLLPLVLNLLGSVVRLLLTLLCTSPQTQNEMERRFLLDVIVRQCSA